MARSRAARCLTTPRSTCGMRAAGVPLRGENGKTCRCVRPHSSTILSEFSNISSVSVGKPAMMSAPKTMSGRSCPRFRAEADGVVAQMPALHALQNHVVAGLKRQMQMRHQPALGRDRFHQIGIGLDGIDGGQPQPLQVRHLAQDRLDQLAELRRCRAGRRRSWSCRRRSAPLRHSRCRQGASPARRPRPSAQSVNCRGRKG